jgi:hypothetical protein
MWKVPPEKSKSTGKQSEGSRGQGKPEVVQSHGRPKAAGGTTANYHGLAALPLYREAKPTGSFAPQDSPLTGSRPARARATS